MKKQTKIYEFFLWIIKLNFQIVHLELIINQP